MPPSRVRRSTLALLVGLAIVVGSCGSASNTGAPSATNSAGAQHTTAPSTAGSAGQSDQAIYAKIERQVEALRELTPTSTVTPVLLDSQGVSEWLTKANAAQTDHAALANESRLFADLGLIPAGSSLEKMELDLEAGQVVGFYDPVSKGLYVLSQSGGVGPTQKLTFSHEYTHALQDQNFGLEKLATNTPDQSDRDLARTSLPEGDATLLMTLWMQQNLSMVELLQIAGESLSGPQAGQLANAPEILRQTLTFPYEQGLAFVQGAYNSGGWPAVDRLYSHPPDSTSQILHPDLYASGIKPVALTLPPGPASLGSGWKLTMQDTLGEFQLGIWLEGQKPTSVETATAQSATGTWAGDRVGLYEGPNGAWAVVLETAWRTVDGRSAFENAARTHAGELPGPAVVCSSGNEATVYVASNVTSLEAFAPCRPPL